MAETAAQEAWRTKIQEEIKKHDIEEAAKKAGG